MGAINDAFNKAGWSILSLASATAKYRAIRNEEGKNRAKLSYNTAATIKKQNDELTKNQSEATSFGELLTLNPEIDEQKIAEQKVLEQMAQEKAKVAGFGELAGVEEAPAPKQKYISSEEGAYFPIKAENTETELPKVSAEHSETKSFSELPIVSAENSETNISAEDPEVQGLINVKQKNSLRSVAGQRSQERYQNIKEKLTYRFADEHNINDVWRNISLEPNITDEMIRKAGFTKTQILEEWKWFNNSPLDWIERQNIRGDEYGVVGNVADTDDFSSFGRLLSAYIKAKAGGKTLVQQQEEYDLSKAEEEPEEENYKVWQDDSTEEEKDETKTDKDSGIIF